jgi:hypothetical protein
MFSLGLGSGFGVGCGLVAICFSTGGNLVGKVEIFPLGLGIGVVHPVTWSGRCVGARDLSWSLHVIYELEERLTFDLLLSRVLERIQEVEERRDEAELVGDEARADCGGDVTEEGERLEEWR